MPIERIDSGSDGTEYTDHAATHRCTAPGHCFAAAEIDARQCGLGLKWHYSLANHCRVPFVAAKTNSSFQYGITQIQERGMDAHDKSTTGNIGGGRQPRASVMRWKESPGGVPIGQTDAK